MYSLRENKVLKYPIYLFVFKYLVCQHNTDSFFGFSSLLCQNDSQVRINSKRTEKQLKQIPFKMVRSWKEITKTANKKSPKLKLELLLFKLGGNYCQVCSFFFYPRGRKSSCLCSHKKCITPLAVKTQNRPLKEFVGCYLHPHTYVFPVKPVARV